jgi:acyl carrier protein
MNPAVLNRVQHILADIFHIPVEQITLVSSPDTIESWDSLNHLNLVLAIEQEFGVQIMPEEIEQLLSVEHIIVLLDEKLNAAGKSQ